jgi:hypothetical protein
MSYSDSHSIIIIGQIFKKPKFFLLWLLIEPLDQHHENGWYHLIFVNHTVY